MFNISNPRHLVQLQTRERRYQLNLLPTLSVSGEFSSTLIVMV